MSVVQATGQFHASVPAAPTSESKASQSPRVCLASLNDDLQVSSQPEPKVTSVEPPPTVRPTVWDHINGLGAILVSLMNSSSQGAAVAVDATVGDATDAPLPQLPSGIDEILRKYQHLYGGR